MELCEKAEKTKLRRQYREKEKVEAGNQAAAQLAQTQNAMKLKQQQINNSNNSSQIVKSEAMVINVMPEKAEEPQEMKIKMENNSRPKSADYRTTSRWFEIW